MQIRCGTFNLYQFVEPPFAWYEPENVYSNVDWLLKKDWIKEQLLNMNCDIVGLQEVFSCVALRNLLEDLGFTYFETVEIPITDAENNSVFIKPVVAIASKYQIKSVEPVKPLLSVIEELPIEKDFKFSRIPIKAKIHLQGFGDIIFYVCHLKSKKPLIKSVNSSGDDTWDKRVLETLRSRSKGHVTSLLQRGAEAALLYYEITETLNTYDNIPIVLLGDLNDDEHSIPIEALTNRERLFEVDGIDYSELPNEAKMLTYRYRLYDSFDLAPNPTGQKRSPTHYYKGLGSVLDYVLVSNAFNEKNQHSIGRVTSNEVFDQHLKSDRVGDHKQSDHAQVVTTINFEGI